MRSGAGVPQPGMGGPVKPTGGVWGQDPPHLLGDPGYQLFCLKHHLVGVAALHHFPIHSAADL